MSFFVQWQNYNSLSIQFSVIPESLFWESYYSDFTLVMWKFNNNFATLIVCFFFNALELELEGLNG